MYLVAFTVMVVVAMVAGVAANYYFGARNQTDPKDGVSVTTILSTTSLLAGLLLALVIADAGSSYSTAKAAAKQEADSVIYLSRAAEYVDQPFREKIQAAAACYARAVAGPEWKTLANGKLSPVPLIWAGSQPGGLRATFVEMTADARGFSLVEAADTQRSVLRTERLAQSVPALPSAEMWFLVVLLALSMAGLAYSVPRAENGTEMVALAVVAVSFVAAVGLVYNLDRPFTGALALKPTQMRTVSGLASSEYAAKYGTPLPCDDNGNRLAGTGGSAPATTTPTSVVG